MVKFTTKIRITKKYSGKSKDPFWGHIVPGDILALSMDFRGWGGYSEDIRIENLSNKETTAYSGGNLISRYLCKLEYEYLND